MKKNNLVLLTFLALIISVATMVSCSKKFDSPPTYVVPTITANKTIAALKSGYSAGTVKTIGDSSIISGIVVANDQSGNIFKEIFIQDSTGGIQLKLNGTNLYASYPVGMQVFIKCNGLALSDYNNDMELGAIDNTNPNTPAVTGIPLSLFYQYIVAGNLNNTITPKIVTLSDLSAAAAKQPALDNLQNTLIQVASAEFASSAEGLVYSDTTINKASVNRSLEDCSGGKTVLYTSGYASFAGAPIPSGNGTITAVYVPYKTTSELLLRDTSDVKFTGARCGGTILPGGGDLTIAALRALYTGSNIALASYTIRGVVISDAASKNISTGAVIIQQGNAGISVYFGGTITYNVGDSIVITTASTDSLQNYKGSLELKMHYGATKPSAVATGISITPNVLTIGALNTALASALGSPANIELTLVKLAGVTSPGGTYSGSKTITDGSGSTTLYTSSSATFASTTLPTGSTNFIGYGSNYSTSTQFQIRNANDVSGGTTGGGGTGGTGTPISIAALRATYTGSGAALSSYEIGGIVISDATNKNISTGDVIIQSGNAGISVYFGGTITYSIGDSIVIDIASSDSLISYKGSLEIKMHSGATKPTAVTTGNVITPAVKTISQLNTALGLSLSDPANIEYTLVTIAGVTVPAGTYSGSKTITDASGSMTMYTTTGATFSASTLPTGSHNYTGYVNTYNTTKEFQIRNTTDVN